MTSIGERGDPDGVPRAVRRRDRRLCVWAAGEHATLVINTTERPSAIVGGRCGTSTVALDHLTSAAARGGAGHHAAGRAAEVVVARHARTPDLHTDAMPASRPGVRSLPPTSQSPLSPRTGTPRSRTPRWPPWSSPPARATSPLRSSPAAATQAAGSDPGAARRGRRDRGGDAQRHRARREHSGAAAPYLGVLR